MNRILVVAGGTGGHIVPGLALAASIIERGGSVEFLSIERNREYPGLSGGAFPVHFYDEPPFPSGPLALFVLVWKLWRAVRRARHLFQERDVQALVVMGGYPGFPALLAARISGRPFFLCEQNAVAGRVTRLFAKRARVVFLNLPLAQDLPGATLEHTGNPLRPALLAAANQARESQSRGAPCVLVLGGSQGAVQLNEIVLGLVPKLEARGVRLLWQCGERNLDSVSGRLPAGLKNSVELFGYRAGIESLFLEADVLFARAGAGVISEGLVFGLPMLLVPYPFAADNHQKANARILAEAGAAVVIDQRDNDPAATRRELLSLLDDPERRARMAASARRLARPEAAAVIAERVLENLRGAGQPGQ